MSSAFVEEEKDASGGVKMHQIIYYLDVKLFKL